MGVTALLANLSRVRPLEEHGAVGGREMERKARKILFIIISILLALVCLLFFLVFVGLGVAAAVIASDCDGNSNSLAQRIIDCRPGGAERRLTSFYYMIGSTIAALIFPLLATVLSYFIVELIIMFGKDEAEKEVVAVGTSHTDGTEMVILPGNLLSPNDPQNKKIVAEFHTYYIQEVNQGDFHSLKFTAAIMLFFAYLFMMLALIGLLWMIVVSYDFYNQATFEVWPFIVTELIVGLVCPIFLLIGVSLLAIVIAFVTAEQVDLRIAVQRMLPSVVLANGETCEDEPKPFKFWIIVDQFYIRLKKPCGELGQLRHAIDKNLSTWLIVLIGGLAMILTVSYFVNQTLVQALTVPVQEYIQETDICMNYACFNETNFAYFDVNCTNIEATNFEFTSFLHCFRFLEFGKDADIITNLSVSVGFYLAAVHFFQIIFFVITLLMHIKPTKAWGILMIIAGVGVFAGAMAVLFSPRFVTVQLDVIQVGQFFLLSLYLVFIGILLCTGKIHQIVPAPVKKTVEQFARPKEPQKPAKLEAAGTVPSGATHV